MWTDTTPSVVYSSSSGNIKTKPSENSLAIPKKLKYKFTICKKLLTFKSKKRVNIFNVSLENVK